IDPKNGGASEAFRRNLARAEVTDHVTPIVATSDAAAEMWYDPVRLLWIDGAHSYDQVGRDFRTRTPFVVDRGIVALHDTSEWDGVGRVIDEQVIPSNDLELIAVVDSIAAFRKTRAPGLATRLRSNVLASGRHHYSHRTVRGGTRRFLKNVMRLISTTR